MPVLMTEYRGELAALCTAMCWVCTSLAFGAAGRRVGPTVVNVSRLFLAVVLLGLLHFIDTGLWVPEAPWRGIWLLALSGIIGLSVGDQLLFTALVDVGSRMSTLLMTLAPPVVAIVAWFLLGERITLWMLTGMTVTLGGIILVVRDRPSGDDIVPHPHWKRGVIFGTLAAWCQGIGFVIAKLAMNSQNEDVAMRIDPLAATLVRMSFAAVGVVVLANSMHALRGQAARQLRRSTPRGPWSSAIPLIVMGTVFGPVLGVWMSLEAAKATDAGIAATLMAMTPVFILPFAALIEHERVTWRAAVGAVIAVAGVAILAVMDDDRQEPDVPPTETASRDIIEEAHVFDASRSRMDAP